MAKMCKVSRSRFYQLVQQGFFPTPDYDSDSGRPFYNEAKQQIAVEVKRSCLGVNGRRIMFYAPRRPTEAQSSRLKAQQHKPRARIAYAELIDSLSSLGINATAKQVEIAIRELYSSEQPDLDSPTVIKAVFLKLRS
ncbi:hypothetical protein OAG68_02140 [bacterium]|nr:hypothetical protein [bacterium]